KRVIILSIILAIVLLFVWDSFIDPPVWWRFERQQDKRAILEYVENNYPNTIKRKGGKFPLQMPAGPFEDSVMFFEYNGVNFSVSAWGGEVKRDTYYEAKAEKYIRENFIDGFMNDRGLSPDIKISFVSQPSHFGMLRKDVLDDVHSFEGSIHVTIKQTYIVGVSTPRDVGWFYDFYQYWMENCNLTNCAVLIYYFPNNDYATDEPSYNIEFKRGEKTFSDEDDFYAGFIR
ncbi:MAG: hypothetical protein ACI4JS_01290, partial [Oscillospiraceae bacterium]